MQFLELAGLLVLPDIVRMETTAVHGHIDAGAQGLDEGQGVPQVEESVGAAEFIGDHGAGQDDGLSGYFFSQHAGGDGHGIGAMRDNDPVLSGRAALMSDQFAIFVAHVEAVDHHEGSHGHFQRAAAALQHFGKMRLFEEQLPGQFIVFLVEGPAGHKYSDGHIDGND